MKRRDTDFSFNIGTVNHRAYSVCTKCCRYKILNFLFLGEFLTIFSVEFVCFLVYFLK
jgi:hypothetical protein